MKKNVNIWGAMNFPHGKPKFPRETYVSNLFVIINISCSFYIGLQSNKFWTHLFPTEHGCSLGQLRSLSLSLGDDMVVP